MQPGLPPFYIKSESDVYSTHPSSSVIVAVQFDMEISYDDEQESEPIYGRGGKIRGYGTGNQKNSVKLSLLREDFNEMCRVIQSKGYKNFYKYVIPKIVVNYADEGASTCTDVLTNIVLSKRSFKAAQGDKSMKVDLDGIAMGGIKINGLDA